MTADAAWRPILDQIAREADLVRRALIRTPAHSAAHGAKTRRLARIADEAAWAKAEMASDRRAAATTATTARTAKAA